MLVGIGALVVCVGVLLALAWLPVEIRVHFEHGAHWDNGEVEVRCLLGVIRWKKRFRELAVHRRLSAGVPDVWSATRQLWRNSGLRHLRRLLQLGYESLPNALWLLHRCEVHQLRCRVRVGASDVVSSGMAFGSVWAIVCSCLGPLSALARFRSVPDIGVSCEFGRQVFELAVDCMMRVRTGHLIRAGLQLVRVLRRRSTDGTPDSRVDADRHVGHSGNG
ncbi:MAG: DUF2953 domain-containing protein [Alicyclobacillaceae bacterium]|nr:DUF2953 domain-containing protein [Alicyclobacillaceae bacterium]